MRAADDVSGRLVIKTPAKLNLRLRLLGLRGDGYHEIITWMQQISLYDEIHIEPCEGGIHVHANRDDVPDGEDNLVYRAARALREASGSETPGARIYLKKNIPAGAGLGGGSANAAGTLWALNKVWDLEMEKTRLSAIAARLGSDVPFFLYGPAAVCRGRGERVEKKEALKSGWFLLVVPPLKLSTDDVYAWSRERLRTASRFVDGEVSPVRLGRYEYGNDLEAVVFPRFPVLKNLCGELVRHGARRAMMSGSGSALFGVFHRKADAERAAARIREHDGCECFITKPLQETFWGKSNEKSGKIRKIKRN